jgi:hypothetical protein
MQQAHRVDVLVAAFRAPVQAPSRAAAVVRAVHRADQLTPAHRLVHVYRGADRLVLRTHPVRVRDHDQTAPRDRSGEGDRSRTGRGDRPAGRRGKVHAEMSGPVRSGRRIEAVHHPQWGERRGVDHRCGAVRGASRTE